jgi:phosphoribosylformimino-5-aminoimidazole carboxamide ribotide isomerase
MEIIPSFDLLESRVVRLKEGKLSEKITYGMEPGELCQGWKKESAFVRRVHCIDLDAVFGNGNNRGLIPEIAACGLGVQWGGGVKTIEEAQDVLERGASEVIVGSRAIDVGIARKISESFPKRVVASVDLRGGKIVSGGWMREDESSLESVFEKVSKNGIREVIVGSVARDGLMKGIELELLSKAIALTKKFGLKLCYSGGVGSIEDVKAAEKSGADSLIVGRALLEGKFNLREAVEAGE